MGSVGVAGVALPVRFVTESGRRTSFPSIRIKLLSIVGIGTGGGGGTDGMNGDGEIGRVGMNPVSRFRRLGMVLLMLRAGPFSDITVGEWLYPTRITVEPFPGLDTSIWFPFLPILPNHLPSVIVNPVMLVPASFIPACEL